MLIFKVTKQFGGGKEIDCSQFKTLDEARQHANDEAANNAAMKVKVIYRIYEFDDLIQTIDSDKVEIASNATGGTGSAAGGKTSGATFKPTPFEMAPRPTGTAPKWLIDPEEDDKKDK